MTNESSYDSTRHDPEVSPRRAARAARLRAETFTSEPVVKQTVAESVTPPEAPAQQAPAAPTEAELAAQAQRTQAVAAAQRARTESAQRARAESIEAQRAAAERVRETLRANAASPRRAAARSAASPASPAVAAPAFSPSAAAALPGEPFDQDLAKVQPAEQPAPAAEIPVHEAAEPTHAPATRAPHAAPPAKRWDAREHHTMSFHDVLNHPGDHPSPLRTVSATAKAKATGKPAGSVLETVPPHLADVPDATNAPATPRTVPAAAAEPAGRQDFLREHFTDTDGAHGHMVQDDPVQDNDAPEHSAPEHADQPGPTPEHPAAGEYPDAPAPLAYGEVYGTETYADPSAEQLPAHEYDFAHPSDDFAHDAVAHDFPHEDPATGREALFLAGDPEEEATRRKARRRRNAIMAVVLLGFAAVIFGVVMILQGVMAKLNPADYPAPGGAAISFEVKPGWGPKQIGRALVADDIVASDKLFVEAIQLVETDNREIHPGTYDLRVQMPALDAATILIGEGGDKVGYVAIKQNTRLNAVLEETAKASGLPLKDFQALAKDPTAFGITSGAKNLEGYLHPGEYRFPVDADASSILQMMVDATQKSLTEVGITDPAEQYRALKIASILQAEARPNDYATVAGALENRMHPSNTQTNGLLQVDSTVIYGLDRYTLHFTKEEKADASNPFNSYVHKGLPPTPIGSPGDSALKAAANPQENDYYYWVTVNTNTGETKFAKTYAEHQVNQNEFRGWCAANKDVCK